MPNRRSFIEISFGLTYRDSRCLLAVWSDYPPPVVNDQLFMGHRRSKTLPAQLQVRVSPFVESDNLGGISPN